MANSKGIRLRFAELRAGGKTLSMLEKSLKVKKSILIEWEKEQQFEIIKLRERIRKEVAIGMKILLQLRIRNLQKDDPPRHKDIKKTKKTDKNVY